MRRLLIPNKEWAANFLEFQEKGDDMALNYLNDMFEDNFDRDQRLEHKAIRGLVYGLINLHDSITEMEFGQFEKHEVIEGCYTVLMQQLIKIALISRSMPVYVIYNEFGMRKLTDEDNYNSRIQNASKITDVSKFDSDEAVKQYLITNWKLLENQIKIIR